MGLLDKAKNLASKAVDSAKDVSGTVLEKSGVAQKFGLLNTLAFGTDEDLREIYLNRAAVQHGVMKVASKFTTNKISEQGEDPLGISASVNEFIDKFVIECGEQATSEEMIDIAVTHLKEKRKALQVELLVVWKNSHNHEERAMYEKYKDAVIWIKE